MRLHGKVIDGGNQLEDGRLLACSRVSDSWEEAKVKGTRIVGGTSKRKEPSVFCLSCSRFLSSAVPTLSEPGIGWTPLGPAIYVSV